MRVFLARWLAHIYCLFHWSWNIFYTTKDGEDENGEVAIVGAGPKQSDGIILVKVQTYPKWLIYEIGACHNPD